MKNIFHGAQERNLTLQSLSEKEILEIVSKIQYKLGEKIQVDKKNRKRRSNVKVVKEPKGCWKKMSIFLSWNNENYLRSKYTSDYHSID